MTLSVELRSLIQHLRHAAGLCAARLVDGPAVRWDRWLALADEHQVGAFLASRGTPVPEPVQRALEARYMRSALAASFRTPEHFRLADRLEPCSHPVALKGAALIHTLYAEAAEREMSDLDLLVSCTTRADAAELELERRGYRRSSHVSEPPEGHHHRHPRTSGGTELTVELHTNLMTPELPHSAIEEMCASRVRVQSVEGAAIHVLPPVFATLHHALHASSDPIDTPLLRNLFELGWMASRLTETEQSKLRSYASRWRIEDRVALSLAMAAELFGTPVIVDAASSRLDRAWCRARLEWAGSRGGRAPKLGRFVRDIARRYFARGGGSVALICAFGGAVWSAGRAVAGRWHRPKWIEKAPLDTARFGDVLIGHDTESGRVHVIGGLSAEVFEAVQERTTIEGVGHWLETRGVARDDARSILHALIGHGVLRAG